MALHHNAPIPLLENRTTSFVSWGLERGVPEFQKGFIEGRSVCTEPQDTPSPQGSLYRVRVLRGGVKKKSVFSINYKECPLCNESVFSPF